MHVPVLPSRSLQQKARECRGLSPIIEQNVRSRNDPVDDSAAPGRIGTEPERDVDVGIRRIGDAVRDAHVAVMHQGGPAAHEPSHGHRSEEHTSELQSLMRISYAVFCLKKKNKTIQILLHTIIT